MNPILIMGIVILAIAVLMSMVGKGGGNFYVLAMVLAGVSMHHAATTSQLMMMGTSLAAMLVFHKHKKIDWKLALIIDPPTDIMAFLGGYFSNQIEGNTLKLMFAFFLILISIFMMIPIKEKTLNGKRGFGYWNRSFGEYQYNVNLWLILPLTAFIGFFSGAIGISGGAFKIPLMVMLCGIPMEIAIGTSSAMVAATALMGFLGHSLNGDFNPKLAIPLTLFAIVGGLLGSKFAVKSKPKNLKLIFAITNLIAAVMMIINVVT